MAHLFVYKVSILILHTLYQESTFDIRNRQPAFEQQPKKRREGGKGADHCPPA